MIIQLITISECCFVGCVGLENEVPIALLQLQEYMRFLAGIFGGPVQYAYRST